MLRHFFQRRPSRTAQSADAFIARYGERAHKQALRAARLAKRVGNTAAAQFYSKVAIEIMDRGEEDASE
jgi:hypothetical protein